MFVDVDVYVASAFDFAQIALNGRRFGLGYDYEFTFNFDSEHRARSTSE